MAGATPRDDGPGVRPRRALRLLDSPPGVAVACAVTAVLVAVVMLLLPGRALTAPLWTQVLGWPSVVLMRSEWFQRRLGGGSLDNRLALRLGIGCAAFAALLWPTGMSFLFPLFAALVCSVHLSWTGARAWRAGVTTMLLGTSLVQASVHAGWQTSLLPSGVNAVVAVTVLVASLATVGNAAVLSRHKELAAVSLDQERRSRDDELRHAATHDQLTGLLNRAGIFEVLELDVAAAEDGRRPGPGLLFIDLDDFKPVNDRYGHAAGDLLLRLVADRLTRLLRPGDRLARLGGDEFIVSLAPPLDHAGLQLVSSRVRAAVESPFDLDGTPVRISASIGAAGWQAGTRSVDEHLHRADSAMYVVKARRSGVASRRG